MNPEHSTEVDRYWKLRPDGPTPTEEQCHCLQLTTIMLRDSFSNNPHYCMACNGEVTPERVGFDASLSEDIARWLDIHRSLFRLWLSSGEYERWASDRLSDPNGAVNVTGRELTARLSQYLPTYYWWFTDTEVPVEDRPSHCPVCHGTLADTSGWCLGVCHGCRILVQR
jgi:Zn-ribbon-containing, possibly nucleic-acid-binding protein (DUF2310)